MRCCEENHEQIEADARVRAVQAEIAGVRGQAIVWRCRSCGARFEVKAEEAWADLRAYCLPAAPEAEWPIWTTPTAVAAAVLEGELGAEDVPRLSRILLGFGPRAGRGWRPLTPDEQGALSRRLATLAASEERAARLIV